MSDLKFIGTGSAFSIEQVNNSAYLLLKDKLVLFDCGETVFNKILKDNIITDKINKLDIIITHFHSDHVGSLGSLLFYCRYKNKKVRVVFPKLELIEELLNIFGISSNIYEKLTPNKITDYYLKEYSQLHGDIQSEKLIPIPSYGYHFKDEKNNFFYSGDTSTINNKVLKMFLNDEIKYLYHEITNDGYKAHVQISDLESAIPKEKRHRVYCMHLNDSIDSEYIKSKCFRSVKR